MPVKIIGMIGVTPPSNEASLHVIEGGLSPSYLTEFARAHDRTGFDMVLVGYSSSSAEGFLIALYAATQTERLGYLIPLPDHFEYAATPSPGESGEGTNAESNSVRYSLIGHLGLA
jgi:hypothetical protein